MSTDPMPPAPARHPAAPDGIRWGAWSVWALCILAAAALALWSFTRGDWLAALSAPAFLLMAVQMAPYPFGGEPPDAFVIYGPGAMLRQGHRLDERQRKIRSEADEFLAISTPLGLIVASFVATSKGALTLGMLLMLGVLAWHALRFALLFLYSRKY